jgi:site-specific recombinase XerD
MVTISLHDAAVADGAGAGVAPREDRAGADVINAGHDTRSLQAYLGHRNIKHTVRYTELAPDRFKDFWR